MKINAPDVKLHVDEYLSLSLDNYASSRIDVKNGPIVPGEFLDREASKGYQHGLTGLFIWDWLARRAGILNDAEGQFRFACQLQGYLSLLIEALANGTDECPEKFKDRNLDWDKLKREFSITTSKRSLFVLSIVDHDRLLAELHHICGMAIKQGQLWGWNGALTPTNTAKPDEMLTAYVLSVLSSSFDQNKVNGSDWHANNAVQDSKAVLEGAARFVWNSCKPSSDRSNDGTRQKNDAKLRKIFFLNTLHRLFDAGLIADDKALAFGRSDIKRILLKTIVDIYNNSKNDPLYIASDLMYFFRDTSVNKDRYIRINGDVLLLEGMIFVYGARDQALNSPECAKLVERVQSSFSEEFSEDGNGQRFAVYSAYHAVRALDMLTMTNAELNGGGFFRSLWNFFSGFLSRLAYAWNFRRGVFVESFMTAFGLIGATGAFLFFSFDSSGTFLQPLILPLFVLGFVSSLKLVAARSGI